MVIVCQMATLTDVSAIMASLASSKIFLCLGYIGWGVQGGGLEKF